MFTVWSVDCRLSGPSVVVTVTVGMVRVSSGDLAWVAVASAAVMFRLSTSVAFAVSAVGSLCVVCVGASTKGGCVSEVTVCVCASTSDKIGISIDGCFCAVVTFRVFGRDEVMASVSVVGSE